MAPNISRSIFWLTPVKSSICRVLRFLRLASFASRTLEEAASPLTPWRRFDAVLRLGTGLGASYPCYPHQGTGRMGRTDPGGARDRQCHSQLSAGHLFDPGCQSTRSEPCRRGHHGWLCADLDG